MARLSTLIIYMRNSTLQFIGELSIFLMIGNYHLPTNLSNHMPRLVFFPFVSVDVRWEACFLGAIL
jgi:hypothetical protein